LQNDAVTEDTMDDDTALPKKAEDTAAARLDTSCGRMFSIFSIV